MTTSYAAGRKIYDSDSHVMETLDWLTSYARPEQEGLIREEATRAGGVGVEKAIEQAKARRADPEATRALLEKPLISGPKGWAAYGATTPDERRHALDLLGFEKQLVFPTFSVGQFARAKDSDVLYGGADMLNRHMADFCSGDDRLLAVGYVPLRDPALALATVEAGIRDGIGAFWVSSDPAGERSPSHVDFDPIWATLERHGVPLVLHIGGGRGLDRRYHDNGHPRPSDFLGGGENLRGRDYHAISHSPQSFLTVMIYDQVFQRFPQLMCGVIELGATWVPGFVRILDQGHMAFRKMEPLLDGLELAPSEFFRRNVRVSLFPYEDAGWLIQDVGPEVFMFASDYPHPEGGRDPIGKFDAALERWEIGTRERERFYHGNFASLMRLDAASG